MLIINDQVVQLCIDVTLLWTYVMLHYMANVALLWPSFTFMDQCCTTWKMWHHYDPILLNYGRMLNIMVNVKQDEQY